MYDIENDYNYYYFLEKVSKPLSKGFEITMSLDPWASFAMKGFDKLIKAKEPVFVNSGYYCYQQDSIDKNQFVNAYANEKLFEYIGNWSTEGYQYREYNPQHPFPDFPYKKLNKQEEGNGGFYNSFNNRMSSVKFNPRFMLYTTNSTSVFPERRRPVWVKNAPKEFFNLLKPDSDHIKYLEGITPGLFINKYYVFVDNERPTQLSLYPAFEDNTYESDSYFGIGLASNNTPPIDFGSKLISYRAQENASHFLGCFCGPDIFKLAEYGVPSRVKISTATNKSTTIGELEFILNLNGHPVNEFDYPNPSRVTISKQNAKQMNYFLEGVCLYRIGTTTIEGYKLSRKAKRVLVFDNGFKIYDLNTTFLDRNICEFGGQLSFIQNDWIKIQELRRKELITQSLTAVVGTIATGVIGAYTGGALYGLGVGAIGFTGANKNSISRNIDQRKAITNDQAMGDLAHIPNVSQIAYKMRKKGKFRNSVEYKEAISNMEYQQDNISRDLSMSNAIYQKEMINNAFSYERMKQIGESQKIAGVSQIAYAGANVGSSLIGTANSVVSYINEKALSPATQSGGNNIGTNSALTFWSEYFHSIKNDYYEVNGVKRWEWYWSQDHMKYTPNSYYIEHLNYHLLDNGIPIGLYMDINEILKDNPNPVLNIDPDSVMRLVYQYFDYLPVDYEQEIVEFFSGTFVYWTTKYPEIRGQEFKLIK